MNVVFKVVFGVMIVAAVGFVAFNVARHFAPATIRVQAVDCYCGLCGKFVHAGLRRPVDGSRAPIVLGKPLLRDSPLSSWFSEHFATACEHPLWYQYHGSGTDYAVFLGRRVEKQSWTMSGSAASICHPSKKEFDFLEHLYAHDSEVCRLYLEFRLAPRSDAFAGPLQPDEIRVKLREAAQKRDLAVFGSFPITQAMREQAPVVLHGTWLQDGTSETNIHIQDMSAIADSGDRQEDLDRSGHGEVRKYYLYIGGVPGQPDWMTAAGGYEVTLEQVKERARQLVGQQISWSEPRETRR